MNSKKTKGALFSSVIALVLCFTMLLGTTFAWFTDTVTSTNNIIKSGNLDVEVYYGDPKEEKSIQDVSTLFNDADGNPILWEPGVVAYENLTVVNEGSLALKYQLAINFLNENFVVEADGTETNYGLSTALKVAVLEEEINTGNRDELVNYVNAKVAINEAEWTSLRDLVETGVLYASDDIPTDVVGAASEKTYGIVVYWQPGDSDNNWNVQNGKTVTKPKSDGNYLYIDLGINLYATQFTYEEDSFDHLYDEDADMPAYGVGSGADAEYDEGAAGYDVSVYDLNKHNPAENPNVKMASVVVPDVALAGDIKDFKVEIIGKKEVYEGITVVNGQEAVTYNIIATGLKENNDVPVKVELFVGEGLDPDTFAVYHYEDEIEFVYNPTSGYVIFETTDFSPYTVVYDAESEYVAPETEEPEEGEENPSDLPVANVVKSVQYENIDLPWESYSGWSPTEGLDAQLEAAYTFSCVDTLEEAKESPYANWHCDFVVVLDKDLAANQIFLGGNYGSFGWVGFHNGNLTLEANTEIALLGSVTSNPWTYTQVVENVGTFICGVGDVDDALALKDATFTVMLRLTNPDDAEEFYNVATIEYTFEESAKAENAADLTAALTTGGKVELTGDINLGDTQIAIPAGVTAVLDLNGHSITGTATKPTSLIVNNGTLSITGEGEIAATFNGEVDNSTAMNTISNRGTLFVWGGTISNTGTGNQIGYAIDNYNGASLTVYDGKITASGSSYYDAIRLFCGSNETVVTVNDGEVSSIWAQNPSANKASEVSGTVVINGGTVNATYYENYTTVKVAKNITATVTAYGAGSDNTSSETVEGYTVYSFNH